MLLESFVAAEGSVAQSAVDRHDVKEESGMKAVSKGQQRLWAPKKLMQRKVRRGRGAVSANSKLGKLLSKGVRGLCYLVEVPTWTHLGKQITA